MTVLTPLSSMQEQLERAFNDFNEEFGMPLRSTLMKSLRWPGTEQVAWLPPIEVSETDTQYTVKASVPGMKPEDIQVEVLGQTLQIKGETHEETCTEEKNIHRSEFRYGRFFRQLTLPDYVQAKGTPIQAKVDRGILTVTLQKLTDAERQKITVKVT